jgi:hypothetical protein
MNEQWSTLPERDLPLNPTCFSYPTEKRMPAGLLLQSPWFAMYHKIFDIDSARDRMKQALDNISH